MRRAHSLLLAVAACLPLAGCYYDPDYGYVRNGSGADAYYGEETTTVVSPGYSYYDYGPGCCFSGATFGTIWYDRAYDRRYYDRGRDWHGHPPPRNNWHGRPGDNRPGNWQGNNNRPPGGWRGNGRPGGNDGDNGPRRGNWQGGDNRPSRGGSQGDNRPQRSWQGSNNNRPQGGWRGGNQGGDHRPAASSAPRSAPAVRQAGTGRDRSRFRSGTD